MAYEYGAFHRRIKYDRSVWFQTADKKYAGNCGNGAYINKAFTKPVWIVTPINILEVLTKPLSLCMRLFGNIIAAFTIMELVKAVPFMKFGFPAVFSLYFDLFDGLLQAYIFVFLTSIYLQEAVEEEEEEPKETKKMRKAQKKAEKLAKKQAKKTKAAA